VCRAVQRLWTPGRAAACAVGRCLSSFSPYDLDSSVFERGIWPVCWDTAAGLLLGERETYRRDRKFRVSES